MQNNVISNVHDIYWRLNNIDRFNSVPRVYRETVSSHSYSVVFMALAVSEKMKKDTFGNIDVLKAMKMAILHDVEEVYSGDIVSYLKKDIDFKEALDKILSKIVGVVLNEDKENIKIWEEFKDQITVESRIVRFCDLLTTLLYSIEEWDFGNKYFKDVIFRIRSSIKSDFGDNVWIEMIPEGVLENVL